MDYRAWGIVYWGLLGFSVVGLEGCGGGGGGGSGDDGPRPATSVNPGAFVTDISYPSGNTAEGIAFLSPTGRFVSIVTLKTYADGQIAFDGAGGVSGSGRDVLYVGDEWLTVSGTLDGMVNNSESMTLTGRGQDFQTGIEFSRESSFSDLGVRLAAMEGIYFMDVESIDSVTMAINRNGDLEGSDATGCAFLGTVTIPDTSLNVYEVNFTASNCQESVDGTEGALRNGSYTGVGSFNPAAGMGVLEFGSSNGNVALVFFGDRGAG